MLRRSRAVQQAASDVMSFDHPRWKGVFRPYTKEQVDALAGTLRVEHTIARNGADKFWKALHTKPFTPALGASTGLQAVQQVKAGIEAIYVSGWQVAADANVSGNMYPDQSLYPVNSVPLVVDRIAKSLQRADQIQKLHKNGNTDYFVPIVADAEAGFGGPLNAYELMKSLIYSGAAAVHFEDQVSSEKKCGHLGGKVLLPTRTFKRQLSSARLAADVEGVPTVLIARTDAESAQFVASDCDPVDQPFLTGERTPEGFFRVKDGAGWDFAAARAKEYAKYADLLWCETSNPNVEDARRFAQAVHAVRPGMPLAYNCSPSFNWAAALSSQDILNFQKQLGEIGFKFQFVTLAGFHSVSLATFKLAADYKQRGMLAYSELQQLEFAAEKQGYTASRHQREVGVSYFDAVLNTADSTSSTGAMAQSTETSQFKH